MYIYTGWWFQSLKNMSSSVGMMTFPTEWKVIKHVPNHQSVYIYMYIYIYENYHISYYIIYHIYSLNSDYIFPSKTINQLKSGTGT